jgi:aryl-alcohol dehydrogenase-like predicted oxidoreductase
MEYRTLGSSDITVSSVCLGTMTFGSQNTEAEGHGQLDFALEQGINFIDTAELYAVPPDASTYGSTEKIIGTWLSSRKNRDSVVLATKIAGKGPSYIRNGTNRIDGANIRAALEDSLRRLQTDYVDLYQFHWPNRNSDHFGQVWRYSGGMLDGEGSRDAVRDNFREVLETIQSLQQEGKIREIGLSNETAWGTMQYLDVAKEYSLPRVVSIQNEYNLLDRLFEPDLAEVALREGVGLLPWSPLATGLLTGKYAGGARPVGARWSVRTDANHRDTPQAHRAVEAYRELATETGYTLPELALGFVHGQPFVTSVIIGATTLSQLTENIGACLTSLSDEARRGIQRLRREFPLAY